MKCGLFGINFFAVIIFISIHNKRAVYGNNIKNILNYAPNKPLIAILLKNNLKTIEASDSDRVNIIAPDVNSVGPPHDQKIYDLFAILRSTQEKEDIDSEASKVFEKTENILRQALRIRCDRLDTCVKKCPRKKKYTCTMTCKEAYDDFEVCEKPKKNKQCKKAKCGKTMPPSWILRK